MLWLLGSDRVYINVGNDFYDKHQSIELDDLLELVASSVKEYKGQPLYEDTPTKRHFYLGRTRRCVASYANSFINQFREISAEESAASIISVTQVKRLRRALKEKHGRISCYALVVIHVAYELIMKKAEVTSDLKTTLKKYAAAIHDLVESYYAHYDDALALFLLRCYPVVNSELQSDSLECKTANEFPEIPKERPKNILDES